MDPKQSSAPSGQLDPKLKEAYERVMGLAPNPSAQKAPTQPATPPTQAAPIAQPQVMTTTSPMPQTQPTPLSTVSSMPTMQTVNASAEKPAENVTVSGQTKTEPVHVGAPIHGFVASKQKKQGGLSPVVIVLAAVVFIVVYALVWIKIFNVQIPFLP